jgi:hypothetical protein
LKTHPDIDTAERLRHFAGLMEAEGHLSAARHMRNGADEIERLRDHPRSSAGNGDAECGDCPPAGYPDKSRCDACPQRISSGKETELLATLVYESMRFSIWAAGQGLMAAKGEPTLDPEDFLFDYSKAMDVDDWDGLAEVARDHIRAVPQEVGMREALAFYADAKHYAPGRWVVNGLTRPVLQDGGKLARSALSLSRPVRCEGCDQNYADPPSKMCPGCQAYRDHQR